MKALTIITVLLTVSSPAIAEAQNAQEKVDAVTQAAKSLSDTNALMVASGAVTGLSFHATDEVLQRSYTKEQRRALKYARETLQIEKSIIPHDERRIAQASSSIAEAKANLAKGKKAYKAELRAVIPKGLKALGGITLLFGGTFYACDYQKEQGARVETNNFRLKPSNSNVEIPDELAYTDMVAEGAE